MANENVTDVEELGLHGTSQENIGQDSGIDYSVGGSSSNFSWDQVGEGAAAAAGGIGRGLNSPQQNISYDQGAQQINVPGLNKDLSYMRSTALSGGLFTAGLRKREDRLQADLEGYNEELQGKYDRQKELDDKYSDEFFNQQKNMIKLNEKSLDFSTRIDAAKRAIGKQREKLSGIAGITKKMKDAGIREDSFNDFKIARWKA